MVVYELYFADHMKEQNIYVIERLKQSPLVDLSIKDIRERIEKTYKWFQTSDNLVRQSLMLLDTRSKDLLYFIHLKATTHE
jgi:ethanolamine utilization cobalamin adenosyltransferase